jgi:hypothetical protein
MVFVSFGFYYFFWKFGVENKAAPAKKLFAK